jgi:hypothetical protein
MRCIKKTVESYQLEAFKKYGDSPQMKKAMHERILKGK